MTDIAYRCHSCGSMHEVESIRENLLLDLRPAVSYQPAAGRGVAEASQRVQRLRMTYGMARAIWPRYPAARSHRSSRLQPLRGLLGSTAGQLNLRLETLGLAAGRKAKVLSDAGECRRAG